MQVHQAKFEINKGDNNINQENTVQLRGEKLNYKSVAVCC